MTSVKIDTDKIKDWETFHKVFKEVFGFPDYYGKNMDAWIDCMSSLDRPDEGMTKIHVKSGEEVLIDFSDINNFVKRCPEQYDALVECSAFVNYRRKEHGERAILALSFYNGTAA